MVCTDRYCHSGPGNGDNSILTKLSVMPFCRWTAVQRQTDLLLCTVNYFLQ